MEPIWNICSHSWCICICCVFIFFRRVNGTLLTFTNNLKVWLIFPPNICLREVQNFVFYKLKWIGHTRISINYKIINWRELCCVHNFWKINLQKWRKKTRNISQCQNSSIFLSENRKPIDRLALTTITVSTNSPRLLHVLQWKVSWLS